MKDTGIAAILFLSVLIAPAYIANSAELEIGNLVLNRSITRVGNEFYETFTDLWSPPPELGLVHVEVQEAPSARWGSLLAVSVNGERYYVTRLSSRSKNIEDVAKEAVEQVMMSFARQVRLQQSTDGRADLYGDGL